MIKYVQTEIFEIKNSLTLLIRLIQKLRSQNKNWMITKFVEKWLMNQQCKLWDKKWYPSCLEVIKNTAYLF